MEFRFNVNEVFKTPIVEITHNLIPPGYTGDRRALWDAVSKVGEIVNTMGAASASAQGLTKPITTADRMRNSEHKLYFLIDQKANNGKGAVTGMLKTGNKSLYVFDRAGNHYQVKPPCLLDFYVHESRQRNGLGKMLFEHVLQKENIEPVQMAIDRPSDKLLGFFHKHYSLTDPVKQMNNYVVYDDFFPKRSSPPPVQQEPPVEEIRNKHLHNPNSANGLQSISTPLGRYGARRPPCSMGEIIHNQSPSDPRQEATGVQSMPATNYQGYQQYYSPENAAFVTQSTPNMYYGNQTQVDPNMCQQYQANYQNIPGQNWQQDSGIATQSYGATEQLTQGTTSPYPLQSQNTQISNQNTAYQNQNMEQSAATAEQKYPMEMTTTYSDSYQPRSTLESDKTANAAYASTTEPTQANYGYQNQQSVDANEAAQQQADNMGAAQQVANMIAPEVSNIDAQQDSDVAAQQGADFYAQQGADSYAQQAYAYQHSLNAAQQQAENVTADQLDAGQGQAADTATQEQIVAAQEQIVGAQQQAMANMTAQQANFAPEQSAYAYMTARQQAVANRAFQQRAAAQHQTAAQQQAANQMTAQQWVDLATQQAATAAAQQQAATPTVQQAAQQLANLTAQQAATTAAQNQAANMAAQYQAATMAAQQQAATMASQQQAATMAAQEQAATMAAQHQAATMAAQQQAATMAAQQQAATMAAQQQAATMAAQQQAASMAAQQQAATMAAQQQAATIAAQQKAVTMATQQQAATMAAQQQAASMAAQQQTAASAAHQLSTPIGAQHQVVDPQEAAIIAAQQQMSNMAAPHQSATMAAQQQAATIATQQQVATIAAQQQAATVAAQQAAAQQAATIAAPQQAATFAAQQQANIAAHQQEANMAAQHAAIMAAQQQALLAAQQQAAYLEAQIRAGNTVGNGMDPVERTGVYPSKYQARQPLHSEYATLLPSVIPQAAYQPVQGVHSAPLHPSQQMRHLGAVSQSVPSFVPNQTQAGVSVPTSPQIMNSFQNYGMAAGDHARRAMSAGGVSHVTPVPSKLDVASTLQYPLAPVPNISQNFPIQNSSDKIQLKSSPNSMTNQFIGGGANGLLTPRKEGGDRPSSAVVCGADRFRIIDRKPRKNDGSDNVKIIDENQFRYGYPAQISHNAQKEPEPPSTTKLERPRSLVIQQEPRAQEQAEQEREEEVDRDSLADSIDVGVEELDIEEPAKEKVRVRGATENFWFSESKTPSPRKTPSHLTDQGYFDLKFYHNKLW